MTEDELSRDLCTHLGTNLIAAGVAVTPDTSLESLGLDSYLLMELLLHVEGRIGFTLPVEAFNQETLATPLSLARYATTLRSAT